MTAAATLAHVPYGEVVADHGIDVWPTAGHALIDELRTARGRVAIISAESTADDDILVGRLTIDLGVDLVRLGLALADRPQPPSPAGIELACGVATVLTDLDVLMSPELHVSPLQFLTALCATSTSSTARTLRSSASSNASVTTRQWPPTPSVTAP